MAGEADETGKLKMAKPSWVIHSDSKDNKRQPIYSVDVHPDGKRFATGGGDAKVKIWSTEGLVGDKTTDHLLATLENHSGTVTAVRWSPNGQYLASGSDDSLSMIWHLVPGKKSQFWGSTATPNVEDWSLWVTFKGHTMDVQDIAWSPDCSQIASCSIDNKIMVWQVDKSRSTQLSVVESTPVVVLEGHTGWVKGLSWDPVGRYLCSTSSDNTVLLWRCSDWEIEAKVDKPYEQGMDMAYTRQVSWSPDGCYVCTTHGFDQTKHIAYVIERRKWNDDSASLRLVGHSKPVTTCAFSPAIYQAVDGSKHSTMCAIAGIDKIITVWVTGRPNPLILLKNVFDSHCLDLAWSRDGKLLLAVSLDGHLALVQFQDPKKIGTPLTPKETEKLLRRHYGDLSQANLSSSLLETPQQLELERVEKKRQSSQQSTMTATSTATTSSTSMPSQTVQVQAAPQVESRTKNGRRRITPALLTQVAPAAAITAPGVNGNEAQISNSPNTGTAAAPEQSRTKRRRGNSQTEAAADTGVHFPPAPEIIQTAPHSLSVEATALSMNGRQTIRLHRDVNSTIVLEVVHGQPQDDLGGMRLAVVSRSTNGKLDWQYQVIGQVNDAVGNKTYTSLVVNSSQIHILGSRGQPVLPPIDFGVNVAALYSSPADSPFLMAINANGNMWVWNLDAQHATASNVPVQPLSICSQPVRLRESGEGRMVNLMVTKEGVPVVMIAQKGKEVRAADKSTESADVGIREECAAFSYHPGMRTWLRVADPRAHLRSQYKSSLGRDYVNQNSTLAVLQATMNDAENSLKLRGRNALKASTLLRTAVNTQQEGSGVGALNQRKETRLHLETQLARALALKSRGEYLRWLRAYLTILCDDEDVPRIRAVCDELLGPETRKSTGGVTPVNALALLAANDLMAAQHALASGDDGILSPGVLGQESGVTDGTTTLNSGFGISAASKYWAPMLIGVPKRHILKTVAFPILGKYRSLQRVAQEYSEALKRIQDAEAAETTTVVSNTFGSSTNQSMGRVNNLEPLSRRFAS